MKKMGNSTAAGLGGLDNKLLKMLQDQLSTPIAFIINMSINKSTFPTKWKLAKLIPLFKGKGKDKFSPDSFRPISILPALSKIAERVIQKQLAKYLENSQQLNINLHAYRPRHSTTTATAQLTDSLFEATDNNLISTMLSVDQSAAFDTVPHEILLDKLNHYIFDVKTTQWFRSYLTHRSHCVEIGGKLSGFLPVKSGVPQGSILGPTLYSLYMNEIPYLLKKTNNCNHLEYDENYLFGKNCQKCGLLITYADDTTLIMSTNQHNLIKGLNILEDFLTSNKLTINRDKTTIAELMIGQKL